jgi:hypothetical protein
MPVVVTPQEDQPAHEMSPVDDAVPSGLPAASVPSAAPPSKPPGFEITGCSEIIATMALSGCHFAHVETAEVYGAVYAALCITLLVRALNHD